MFLLFIDIFKCFFFSEELSSAIFCQSIFDNLKAEEAGGLIDARTIKAEPRTQTSIKLVVTSRDLKHQQGNYESLLLP